jgi:hypothetical protein
MVMVLVLWLQIGRDSGSKAPAGAKERMLLAA